MTKQPLLYGPLPISVWLPKQSNPPFLELFVETFTKLQSQAVRSIAEEPQNSKSWRNLYFYDLVPNTI